MHTNDFARPQKNSQFAANDGSYRTVGRSAEGALVRLEKNQAVVMQNAGRAVLKKQRLLIGS